MSGSPAASRRLTGLAALATVVSAVVLAAVVPSRPAQVLGAAAAPAGTGTGTGTTVQTVPPTPEADPGARTTPGAGGGQADAGAAPPVELPAADGITLVDQTDWVDAGQPFDLRFSVGDDVEEGASIVLDLHAPVTSRSQFTTTLEGRFLGARRAEVVVPLAELAPEVDGTRRVRLTSGPTAVPGEREVQGLTRSGVYPLVVALRPADTEVDPPPPFTTYLVRTPPPGTTPLRVAVVQPVEAPLASRPDGTTSIDATTVARLGALAEVLTDASDVPLTLAARPETLEALAVGAGVASPEGRAAAAVLADLAAAAGGRQVVSEPWVDVDVEALQAAGLADDIPAQRRRGDEAVEATLGTSTDARTWVADDALGPAALERLASIGVDQVIFPDEVLSPVELRLSLTRPFAISTGDTATAMAAAAPEPALSARYTSSEPVLAAQHLLADLAVLQGDEPGPLRPRGVVLAPPPGVGPDPTFLSAVLAGLATAPILQPVTLEDWFRDVDPQSEAGEPLVRTVTTAAAPAVEGLGVLDTEVVAARERIAGLGSMVRGRAALLRDLTDLTLLAEADGLALPERQAYLAAVGAGIDPVVGSVGVVDAAEFRLADTEGTIPLTLVRETDEPLLVRVTLESQRLAFGPDEQLGSFAYDVELSSENTPLVVPVEVRSPGTFPLLVTITSPDGRLQVTRTQVTIHSTAFSGVGVALSAGAGFFLLLWWGRHWRTVRRARSLVPVT